MPAIGENNLLRVVRDSPYGLYLDGGQYGEILLPQRFVPTNSVPGGELEVFLYRDSEDRLVATTETPVAFVDEFAFLKIVDYKTGVGAFLDFGVAKHLLLPISEQKGHVAPGDRVVVYIKLDDYTDRLVATMRLDRHLNHTKPRYAEGQTVNVLIAGETPLGYNAIVENAHRGLLYHSDLNANLQIGQRLKAFVTTVRPDDKIDLKLDAAGYTRIEPLADQILKKLEANGGRLEFDDSSPPEAIRFTFGVSKKAFKQALGQLLRQNKIGFSENGINLIRASD
ncbi:GntR family transcriptional regulator [Phragmitibacter flavus]|uniref:GntR family transcriptional regulator n=1 Tax=Phragmitibacter flavus TaxID=2576071 RepID=A0A5R8KFT6_9BACT|nr:S1-like domain-containing RNA-binding protein [Phragmitibacter flavus]TLD71184.1 GntR family transcriptional regulator [Phragmitibacter flavus]